MFEIIIVGGGTAGWLSAAFLQAQLPDALNQEVHITVVEASDIPTIGVGEATLPSLKDTLAACKIDEHEFMTASDATFKHGIEFVNWVRSPTKATESYFHPFGSPILVNGKNVARQWSQLAVDQRGAFADIFSVQPEMAKSNRAPKHIRDRAYDGALSYAFHLDAGKLAEFLKAKCKSRGVSHLIEKINAVKTDESGAITGLQTESQKELKADFFIDCTGFAARLINHDASNSFIDKNDVLFVDRAVTVRTDHKSQDDIRPYTKCTAQDNGWIWDITLTGRSGVGYVYTSKYCDENQAAKTLAEYLNTPQDQLDPRYLKMRIGYYKNQWMHNYVGIGLASGFLEPLESTGIYLTEMANWALLELLPRFASGVKVQERYNQIMAYHYENIVDFLKLHYCLSQRDDSAFWRDNRSPETIPLTLQNHLKSWENSVPSVYDFDRVTQCFSATNYQFVLYGMQWPGHHQAADNNQNIKQALKELSIRRDRLKQFVTRDTINHLEYLNALQ